MICPNCEALRAENVRLAAAAQQVRGLERRAAIQQAFGLGVRTAGLLSILYQAAGDVLTREQLRLLIGGEADNSVRVYIGRLRDLLGTEAVLNERGSGYRLSTAGIERVQAAIGEAA